MIPILRRRTTGIAPIIILSCLSTCVATAQTSEIVLTVRHGPGQQDVTLQWTGGQSGFEVFRSSDKAAVCQPGNLIGTTDAPVWIDPAPPGTVFYRIHSPFAAEPPEVCNGKDDDCDGTVDEQATGCNATLCQDCIDGACRSKCGPCDDCVNGTCQSRCGSCQICAGGTCGPCNPGLCQTCVSGVCQSTCDEAQCQVCGAGGTCVTSCQSCETCVAGLCTDACDRDSCLSCQGGTCRPFCDPVCQTCTATGCRDDCGPCQRCLNGSCQSRCDPNACEDCFNGFCQSRCAPGEACVAGVCGSAGL